MWVSFREHHVLGLHTTQCPRAHCCSSVTALYKGTVSLAVSSARLHAITLQMRELRQAASGKVLEAMQDGFRPRGWPGSWLLGCLLQAGTTTRAFASSWAGAWRDPGPLGLQM